MEDSTSSSQTTYSSTSTTCLNLARADCANTRGSQCSAGPEDCRESAILFTTITETEHSQTFLRKPESQIRTATTAWALSAVTLTKMVGLIFLWRTTQRQTSCTITMETVRLRKSAS